MDLRQKAEMKNQRKERWKFQVTTRRRTIISLTMNVINEVVHTKERCHHAQLPTPPNTHHEAVNSPHREAWTTAMENELETLQAKGTWQDSARPQKGEKILPLKWVFLPTNLTTRAIQSKERIESAYEETYNLKVR